ncbi:MAG: hypothetical protein HOV73_16635 [Streptomyces sp.]|nr:hypothetical protein [Streptomyces sp.]NUR41705.1 hypothetical protein [Streptomyces sp.]
MTWTGPGGCSAVRSAAGPSSMDETGSGPTWHHPGGAVRASVGVVPP